MTAQEAARQARERARKASAEVYRRITRDKLREWGACYSDKKIASLLPSLGATPLQVARATQVPVIDRIWVLTRPAACSERVQRLFAVRCARRALARVANPDPRSVSACDVSERYANGLATPEDLATARSAANAAAYAAAYAAYDAAYAAYAATYAAYAAANAAAYAAYDAANAANAAAYAAYAAAAANAYAADAATDAADAATDAADAAYAAAAANAYAADAATYAYAERESQIADMIELLRGAP